MYPNTKAYAEICVPGCSAAVPFHSTADLQADLTMYNMAEFQKYIYLSLLSLLAGSGTEVLSSNEPCCSE